MNASKARDFFSAYYEGELSGGLKEAFERSLASDASLKQEYDDFCAAMKMLDEPEAEIEIPFDLHDKIMARLDHQAWEEKQNTRVGLFGRWRMAFVGALAVVALTAGVMSMTNRQNGNSAAGFGPGVAQVQESVDIQWADGTLEIRIAGKNGSVYSLKNVGDNSEIGKLTLKGTSLSQPVVNDNEKAQAFGVYDADGNEELLIVLPGKVQGETLNGEGSILELALAIADTHRTPLIVRANDRNRDVAWKFNAGDDTHAVASQLSSQQLNLTVRTDGISVLNSF